jgi:hypothetical protein
MPVFIELADLAFQVVELRESHNHPLLHEESEDSSQVISILFPILFLFFPIFSMIHL